MADIKFPGITVQLTGGNGNAFAIMGTVGKALKRADVSQQEVDQYYAESTEGGYDNLLQVAMAWVDVQ